MRKTITNFAFVLLAFFALADSANAQLRICDFANLGDTFDIEITQQAATGVFRANNNNGFDAPAVFGAGRVIGSTATGVPIIATQTFTDMGGGEFEIQFNVRSEGNLAPAAINGIPIIGVRFVIGDIAGPETLDVLPHVATFAQITIFDQNGDEVGAGNALGVEEFNDPANSFSAFEGMLNQGVGGGLGFLTAVGNSGDRIAEARLTIRGTIEVPPTQLGDVNGDCSVSFLDIAPFISLLSSGDFQAQADINIDGVVSFLDIAPFITLLSN